MKTCRHIIKNSSLSHFYTNKMFIIVLTKNDNFLPFVHMAGSNWCVLYHIHTTGFNFVEKKIFKMSTSPIFFLFFQRKQSLVVFRFLSDSVASLSYGEVVSSDLFCLTGFGFRFLSLSI